MPANYTGIEHYLVKGRAFCGRRDAHTGSTNLTRFYTAGVKRCKLCLEKLNRLSTIGKGALRHYIVGVVETQQTIDVFASSPQTAYDLAEEQSVALGKGSFSERTVGVREVRG